MRKHVLLFIAIITANLGISQNIVFFDNFESGLSGWSLGGTWGLSTNAFTGLYALSESPNGNYPDQTTMIATMDSSVDLSQAMDAEVLFSATYQIEFGFDFMYLEATSDGGNTWVTLQSFTGDSAWYKYIISLGGFVGSNNVKCRFRFVSDDMLNFDGMDIDDFLIMTYTEDNTPPLIVHYPLPHYEGSLYEHQVLAEIIDISGVSFAILTYRIDNVLQPAVGGVNYSGDTWLFEIPPAPAGSWIEYKITAEDSSVNANNTTSEDFEYIAGNYIKYDNAVVDYVGTVSQFSTFETAAAVRIELNDTTTLVSALIRNYIDSNNPNADMELHVWDSDTAGLPGEDLIVPFLVTPAANAAEPHKMTRIDLRTYNDSLSGISGDIFIGFKAPLGDVHVVQTTPAVGNHTYTENFLGWNLSTDDYHFRAVTSEIGGAPMAAFSFDTLADPYVTFTDQSLYNPVSWYWDFDDNGNFSTDQHPQYAFTHNGTFNVCLTVDNGITTNTTCQFVSVQNVQPPIANFYYLTTYSPEILFVDTSLNYPISWFWDFDDNGATWGYINPMHTFSHNDTFNVCLIVENFQGSDTMCQEIIINDYVAPEAAFSYDPGLSPWIQFYNESSNQIINTPDTWYWDFDYGGAFSTDTNALFLFPENGIYNVCLTTTNTYGTDTYCSQVVINSYVAPVADFSYTVINGPVVQFTDQSSDSLINETTEWYWDFGDGSPPVSIQSPVHQFMENGSFNVCLVASNLIGSDTICQTIDISSYAVPTAGFTYNDAAQPVVFFYDQSIGWPQSRYWDFDDQGITSVETNPAFTFSTNDTFNVCLTVSNYLGSDTFCQSVIISSYLPPVANFNYQIVDDTIVHFQDISTNGPTSWLWDFDFNGQTSNDQNPTMIYPVAGDFNVCLTSGNSVGTGAMYCQLVSIVLFSDKPNSEKPTTDIYPLPMQDYLIVDLHLQDLDDISINLYNLLGAKLHPEFSRYEDKLILYRNSLPSGFYFIDILNTSGLIYRAKILME